MRPLAERFAEKYGRWPTEVDKDYLEMLRMSKYRIVVVPDIKPFKCSNCGSTKEDGRKYVDFGLEIDWYGCVFICSACLFDIATNLGLFATLESQLSQANDSLLAVVSEHNKGVELQENFLLIFREVKEYIDNLHSSRTDSSPDGDSSVVSDEIATDSGPDANKQKIDGPKPRVAKPAASSGSQNVRSLAELLNPDK